MPTDDAGAAAETAAGANCDSDSDPLAIARRAVRIAHEALEDSAEVSKRAVAAHKRAQRRQRAAIRELSGLYRQMGLELVIEDSTETTGGHSG